MPVLIKSAPFQVNCLEIRIIASQTSIYRFHSIEVSIYIVLERLRNCWHDLSIDSQDQGIESIAITQSSFSFSRPEATFKYGKNHDLCGTALVENGKLLVKWCGMLCGGFN